MHFVIFESTYLLQIAREKLCDYLYIIIDCTDGH